MSDALPAVIIQPESRPSTKVDRLVKWCRELDGTDLRVIEMSKADDEGFCATHNHNQYACLCAYSLHVAALTMHKKPFIWLEADSIPTKPGWAKALTDEYCRLGKPFMLSSDTHPPGDLVGGIGVYGADTHWMIPYDFQSHGWDRWMIEKIRPLISFTPLIQHKYAIYEHGGITKTRDIAFPRDRELLREDAVIFHRDSQQSLMRKPGGSKRFAHSGCMGDAIAALPVIRQLGGGELVMTQKNNKRILKGERYEILKPLLEAQSYIHSVTWEEDPTDIDYDFTDFRTVYASHRSLAETQASYLGESDLNLTPWLEAEPDQRTLGRIVCARSSRYHNLDFPWKRISQKFLDEMVFVGLDHEHNEFQRHINERIERIVCANSLEMAQVIRGSSLFIGNQSSAFWIAAGLGQNLIQETWTEKPDSIVRRGNAEYVTGHRIDPARIRQCLLATK
jgi:hypothetical protein